MALPLLSIIIIFWRALSLVQAGSVLFAVDAVVVVVVVVVVAVVVAEIERRRTFLAVAISSFNIEFRRASPG